MRERSVYHWLSSLNRDCTSVIPKQWILFVNLTIDETNLFNFGYRWQYLIRIVLITGLLIASSAISANERDQSKPISQTGKEPILRCLLLIFKKSMKSSLYIHVYPGNRAFAVFVKFLPDMIIKMQTTGTLFVVRFGSWAQNILVWQSPDQSHAQSQTCEFVLLIFRSKSRPDLSKTSITAQTY